jgi:hypothetical protein
VTHLLHGMVLLLILAALAAVGVAALRHCERVDPTPTGAADPDLLGHLAERHPMKRRPRVTDAVGPWITADIDGPEFQALLTEVLAVTHG